MIKSISAIAKGAALCLIIDMLLFIPYFLVIMGKPPGDFEFYFEIFRAILFTAFGILICYYQSKRTPFSPCLYKNALTAFFDHYGGRAILFLIILIWYYADQDLYFFLGHVLEGNMGWAMEPRQYPALLLFTLHVITPANLFAVYLFFMAYSFEKSRRRVQIAKKQSPAIQAKAFSRS